MKPRLVGRTAAVACTAVAMVLLIAACSSSKSTTSTTTTLPKDLSSVKTPSGEVSLSLDGKLPANWPAGFQVPPGATPAGSGSISDKSGSVLVGVYSTSAAPDTTFNFFKNNTNMKVASVTTAGGGYSFVGSLTMTQPPTGSVTVVGEGKDTLIVVVLNTTPSTVSSTTPSTNTSQ